MKLKSLFRGYRRRMVFEGLLKALLIGIGVGAFVVLILSIVYHIRIKPTDAKLFLKVFFGIVFLMIPLTFFLRYFPTTKRTAARVDADLDLRDRMGTMVEFWESDGLMTKLQRTDALAKLSEAKPSQLRFSFSKRVLISVIAMVFLAGGVLWIPYNVFASQTEEEMAAANERIEWVNELLEDLREQARAMEENSKLQEQVDEILDELEEDLKKAQSEAEQAAEISDAKSQLSALMEKVLSRFAIGEALQRYRLTQPLGEVIADGDTEGVSTAMEDLYSRVYEDSALITTLYENIGMALADSGVDSSDSLYLALYSFGAELSTIQNSWDSRLKEAFDTAGKAIIDALNEQAEAAEWLQSIMDSLDSAKSDVLGEEMPEGEKPEGEMPEGERPEGEKPEGEMPEGMERPEGEMPEGMEMPEGDGTEINDTMNEIFYDPISGSVEYGDVFASYYADYLREIANGELSDDLQTIIDNYYNALSE